MTAAARVQRPAAPGERANAAQRRATGLTIWHTDQLLRVAAAGYGIHDVDGLPAEVRGQLIALSLLTYADDQHAADAFREWRDGLPLPEPVRPVLAADDAPGEWPWTGPPDPATQLCAQLCATVAPTHGPTVTG